MKFLPGEPGPTAKSLDQAASFLAYCSGNNLILCENGQLVQTSYLPGDGLAVAIDRQSSMVAVLLAGKVLVFAVQESYTKGRSWVLAHTLPLETPATNLSWFDDCLLLCGSQIELLSLQGSSIWVEPNCSGSQLAVAPDTQHFVSINESKHFKLWSRVSSSALAFDIDYLRLPCTPQWIKWRGDCLFAWCDDNVLRGYRPFKASTRFELFINLELDKPPEILEYNQKIYLISLGSTCTVWRLDPSRAIVQPEYLWTAPVELPDFSFENSVMVHAFIEENTLKFTGHKSGLLILANAPNFLAGIAASGSVPAIQLTIDAILTGHTKSIRSISRGSMGDVLFTTSRFDENFVWKALKLPSGEITLRKISSVKVRGVDQSDLQGGDLLTVAGCTLQLWNIESTSATLKASTELNKAPLVAGFTPFGVIAVFTDSVQSFSLELKETHRFSTENVQRAVLADPVGWNSPDRDVFTTIGQTQIKTWAAADPSSPKEGWKETSSLDRSLLGKEPITAVTTSSRKKLALAQTNRLLIWSADTNLIELDQEGDQISDLDWTTTPTDECLLGVGYTDKVVIYCQQRYDYTKQLKAWTPIREISIAKYTTHSIGDSIWLKDGTFVVGAGNQLFIQSSKVDIKDEALRSMFKEYNTISSLELSSTLFDINAVLNGPLPIYHPQFLIQLIYSGHLARAREILWRLLQALKYTAAVDTIVEIDRYLGWDLVSELDASEFEQDTFPQVAQELEQHLSGKTLSYLTRHQQITLLSVIQSVAQINASLDTGATLYMLGYHLFRIHADQPQMNTRDFVWASTSDTKQILLDEVEKAGATAKMDRFLAVGLPFWLELNQLRDTSELLARRMFAVSRDPVQVTLIYLALKKKPLLIGLWRVSSSHPEQAKTLKLLNNNYEQPRWKAAALKNAYALMSKHRYEYAAALFLLGGAVKDACNVLARQLNNLPLAVLVARLYDGDDGEAIRYLQERFVEEPWMLVWTNLMVGNPKAAVLAATTREAQTQRSINDPVLVWMYAHLRSKCALSAAEEMRTLKHTAKTYCRMGCDLVALTMCKEWQFGQGAKDVSGLEAVVPSSAEPEPATISPFATVRAPAADPAEFDPSAFGF